MNVSDGLKIKTIRQLRGLNQFEVANPLGISRAQLSYIENDHIPLSDEMRARIEPIIGLRLRDPLVDAAFAVLANGEADRAAVAGAITVLESANGR